MSRRYEFAMQRQGKGQGKKRKNKLPIKDLDFQAMQRIKDPKESEYEASWRRDLFSPEDVAGKDDDRRAEYSTFEEDLPLGVHAVGIGEQNSNYFGQEFSSITDRISKVCCACFGPVYISSRIFENVTARWTFGVQQFFFSAKVANIKTKSAAIAFFSSPPFLPPRYFSFSFPFSSLLCFWSFSGPKSLPFDTFSLKWLEIYYSKTPRRRT